MVGRVDLQKVEKHVQEKILMTCGAWSFKGSGVKFQSMLVGNRKPF